MLPSTQNDNSKSFKDTLNHTASDHRTLLRDSPCYKIRFLSKLPLRCQHKCTARGSITIVGGLKHSFVSSNHPHRVAVKETFLEDKTPDPCGRSAGYTPWLWSDRKGHGRGIAVSICKSIHVQYGTLTLNFQPG